MNTATPLKPGDPGFWDQFKNLKTPLKTPATPLAPKGN